MRQVSFRLFFFLVASLIVPFQLEVFAQIKSFHKVSETKGSLGEFLEINERFAEAITSLGDINNDGYVELVVGSAVALRILSFDASSNTVENVVVVDLPIVSPITAVANIGDFDGDGLVDLAVGMGEISTVWIVLLNSDLSAKTIYEIAANDNELLSGLSPVGEFGISIASIGDLDEDAIPELLIGYKDSDGLFPGQGEVILVFLNENAGLRQVEFINDTGIGGLSNADDFGHSIANVGDLNNDGIDDFVTTSPGSDTLWLIYINRSGQVTEAIAINDIGGNKVGVVDFLGRGNEVELLVGDTGIYSDIESFPDTKPGSVALWRINHLGEVKESIQVTENIAELVDGLDLGDEFGTALPFVGDLDGDDVSDILIGTPNDEDGTEGIIGGYNRPAKGAFWVLYREQPTVVVAKTDIVLPRGDWADFDNDGDLDLFTTEYNTALSSFEIVFYRNDGPGEKEGAWRFEKLSSEAYLESSESISTQAEISGIRDLNNDGYLDIFTVVESEEELIGYILQHTGAQSIQYSSIRTNIRNIDEGIIGFGREFSLSFTDFNNDGKVDVSLNTRLYRNELAVVNEEWQFSPIDVSFSVDPSNKISWADVDNDGDYDVFSTEYAAFSGASRMYRNEGADPANPEAWQFVLQPSLGVALVYSTADWNDFDHDGDLDYILSVLDQQTGEFLLSLILENRGVTDERWDYFPYTSFNGWWGTWADYNGDGYTDVYVDGQRSSSDVERNLNINQGPDQQWAFSKVFGDRMLLGSVTPSPGDFDGDGDLDGFIYDEELARVSVLFENVYPLNEFQLSSPTQLISSTDGSSVNLSWDDGTYITNTLEGTVDVSDGLTYNLRVGSTSGGQDVMAAQSLPNGKRLVMQIGNANLNNSWTINDLEEGTYYWSVQAVNHAYVGAGFAPEGTFEINFRPPARPDGISVVPGDKEVTLSWEANSESDLQRYRIYRDGEIVDSVEVGTQRYINTGLINGTEYSFSITAVDRFLNESPLAVGDPVTPFAIPPEFVGVDVLSDSFARLSQSLTIAVSDTIKIQAIVSDGDGNVSRASLDWRRNSQEQVPIEMAPLNDSTFVGVILPQNVDNVIEVSVNVEDAKMNEVFFPLESFIIRPDTPSSTIARFSNNSVRLSWVPGSGASSYRLFRREDDVFPPQEEDLISSDIAGATYNDEDVISSNRYYYYVQGESEAGTLSGYSDVAVADIMPPQKVLGLEAVVLDREVQLLWEEALDSDVIRYRVYRDEVLYDSVDVGVESYIAGQLVNSVSYSFVVAAVDEALNESEWSDPVTVIPQAIPPVISNISISDSGSDSFSGTLGLEAATEIVVTATITDLDENIDALFLDWAIDAVSQDSISMVEINNSIYTASIPGQGVDRNITVSVVAMDAKGNSNSEFVGSFVIRPVRPENVSVLGGANEVRLLWSESTGSVSYRVYRSLEMPQIPAEQDLLVAGLTSTTFKDSTVETEKAYNYWVQGISTGGNASSFSDRVEATAFDYAPFVEVNAPNMSFGAVTEPTSYRMVGLPGNNELSIAETFEGSPGADGQWNAFWDNGSDGPRDAYLIEFDPLDGRFEFEPGRGFWVISRQQWEVPLQSVSSVPLSITNEYAIPVHNNWNIISNPFDHAITWQGVQELNGITDPLWEYTGVDFVRADSMKLYKGYYFLNRNAGRDSLRLRYTDGLAAPGPSAGKTSSSTSLLTFRFEKVNSGEKDVVMAGFDQGSKRHLDSLDQFAPPIAFSSFRAYLLSDDLESTYKVLAEEYRPYSGEGEQFVIEIYSQEAEQALLVNVEGVRSMTQEAMYLVDVQSGKFIDLQRESAFQLRPSKGISTYMLLIGGDEFIEKQREKFLPQKNELLVNYPNPFGQSTTITYTLSSNSREQQLVNLEVYDMLGRRVAVLVHEDQPAGHYEVEWDGHYQGSRLANGVYVYRLQAEGFVQARTMVLLR